MEPLTTRNALSQQNPLVALRPLALCLVAAWALTACGGGGGSTDGSSRLNDRSPLTEAERAANEESGATTTVASDEPNEVTESPTPGVDSEAPGEGEAEQSTGGDQEQASDAGGSTGDSQTDTDSGDSGADDGDQSFAAGGDDGGAEEPVTLPEDAPVLRLAGAVTFKWARPDQRENGEELPMDELGGYELRYRQVQSQDYEMKLIDDVSDPIHLQDIDDMEGDYIVTVAAYDKDGLYSDFVALTPEDIQAGDYQLLE